MFRIVRESIVSCSAEPRWVKPLRMRTSLIASPNDFAYSGIEIHLICILQYISLEFNGEDILVDMASDMAGDVERKLMLDNLRLEFKRLSEDEQKILHLIYYHRLSERAVAEHFRVSQNAIHRRKVQILAKLRKSKNLK